MQLGFFVSARHCKAAVFAQEGVRDLWQECCQHVHGFLVHSAVVTKNEWNHPIIAIRASVFENLALERVAYICFDSERDIISLTRSCSMSSIVDGYSEPVRSSVALGLAFLPCSHTLEAWRRSQCPSSGSLTVSLTLLIIIIIISSRSKINKLSVQQLQQLFKKIKLCIKKTKSSLSNWGYTYLQF
ncbi:Hypothetical_protein [Hexamita inflata]|uniref:Hypothetical_protein n=1 Tax=Hexamita inflata TaxID=28002 RepID=A0AA86THD6_9EUKA|nr:Hypothetical protein HINF_LOCUS6239 [Hexamita inflata]